MVYNKSLEKVYRTDTFSKLASRTLTKLESIDVLFIEQTFDHVCDGTPTEKIVFKYNMNQYQVYNNNHIQCSHTVVYRFYALWNNRTISGTEFGK